uniref:ISXO2-like transposase domain n=1 Tax=Candidatus Kentrum sp. LFY TaxID=2126342 RepID=A0A450U6Q0_9GAMM|nr:MAG: ISXO2-like transposase domain [Candidatus Kentron sp. LFY]
MEILKREFNSVYCKISFKHLDRYLHELTFRLNQGNAKIHTMDRISSMVKRMFGRRLTYKGLIGMMIYSALAVSILLQKSL